MLDEQGNEIKTFVIIEASNAPQMEQRILDMMGEGYEPFGELGMSPKGVYFQAMRLNKKVTRVGV